MLDLVPPARDDSPRCEPEQLPLIRIMEVVRDRVEAIHTGQWAMSAELRDIRSNLPMQRRPLSKRTEALHIRVITARRNGLCPCCQATPVCNEHGRLIGAEYDHWCEGGAR
jgi:hypothetical protein